MTRRAALAGLAGAALAPAAAAARNDSRPGERLLEIKASRIASFRIGDREQRDFGQLRFLGGLELSSSDADFGGLSSIRMLDNAGGFVAATDVAHWVTGRVTSLNGAPAGISDARIGPMLSAQGRPLRRTRAYDSEAMAVREGQVFIAFERVNEVLRFEFAKERMNARGMSVPVPPAMKLLPSNRGIEAMGFLPPGSAYAGSLIAVSERSGSRNEPTAGFLFGGRLTGGLKVARHPRFDITDLDFLPNGDMVLLERSYAFWSGVGMRMRRISLGDIKPDAVLDGPVLIEADMGHQIDNMEGLSIHRNAQGQTLFTLVSDDNFSILQRTMLLQFQWMG